MQFYRIVPVKQHQTNASREGFIVLHAQLAALALAATAIFASGCGSSKSSSTSSAASSTGAVTTPAIDTTPAKIATGKPLTSAQLIAQGDAICDSALTKLSAIAAKTKLELIRVLPQGALYLSSEAEGLGKLVPPASLSGDWAQIVNDIHTASEYLSRASQYYKEKQEKAAGESFLKANELNTQAKRIAKRHGFKVCSSFRPGRR
jgi:hypothetical protein